MNRINRFDNAKLPLIMGLISLVSLVIGMRLQDSLTTDGYLEHTKRSEHKAIYEASEHIRAKYYGTLSDSAYTDAVIYEMIDQLDPYSHYFPEAQNSIYDTYIKGVDKGVGIDLVSFNDTAFIYDVIESSSADVSKLERGEVLTNLNGVHITKDNIDTVSVITNGNIGETVKADIYNIKTSESRTVELKIEELNIPLIDDFILQSTNERSSVSYVKIKRFYSNVFRDFMEVMEKHKNSLGQDVSELIIDIRDNPGGVVEETVKILNQFFQEKDLPILSTKSKVNKAHEYVSNGRSFLKVEKIVILCNGSSASASEILAGTLQDHDKVVLIGEDTYGKGLIQQNYDLSNNASINLSIGEYVLPTGRSIYQPDKEDSSFVSINNGRPLISQKGISVDIEMSSCQSSKEYPRLLQDLIVQNKLWGKSAKDEAIWTDALKTKDLDISCQKETYDNLKWLFTKRNAKSGELISEELVDPQMKKAMEVILSKDYDKITGFTD